MGKYLYESIGAQEFSQRHGLTQSACVIAPSTLHISFMKAITILGLGRENIVTVAVDENARMDPEGECMSVQKLGIFRLVQPKTVIEKQLQRPSLLISEDNRWMGQSEFKAQNMDSAESTGALVKIHRVPDRIRICDVIFQLHRDKFKWKIKAQSKYMQPAQSVGKRKKQPFRDSPQSYFTKTH